MRIDPTTTAIHDLTDNEAQAQERAARKNGPAIDEAWARYYDANDDVWCNALGAMTDKRDVAPWRDKREAARLALLALGVDADALLRRAARIPEPAQTPVESDRAKCQTMWNEAGESIQEWADRRDPEGVTAAEWDQQNWAIALDIHNGANRDAALATLRRRYDVLAGYLLLRGGTNFVNACRKAIVEERWGDLVEAIARLEWEHVADGRLRWGTDDNGIRVAEVVKAGDYHIPESLYPGHPFDKR